MQNTKTLFERKNNIDFRNEKKVIFDQSVNYLINFFKFLNFREIFGERQINSIYFETKNFSDLIDTINGEKIRSKLRLRWYGNTFNNCTEMILENKIKNNNHNFKIKYNLGRKEIKNKITTFFIKELVNDLKNLSPESFIKLQTREPNIIISYKRRYFMYNDIRITLDTDLKSRDFYRSKIISEESFFRKKKISVVEMKYQDKSYDDVKKITSLFKNRIQKFSKYESSLLRD